MPGPSTLFSRSFVPLAVGLLAAAAGIVWFVGPGTRTPEMRVPGTDHAPEGEGAAGVNPVLAGKLIPGDGQPAPSLPGEWPGFRGPKRDGISADATPLARSWPSSGPRELWSVDVGEGYGGAAIRGGRVYIIDYDQPKKQSALRCLSLADGKEIWRFAYPLSVKRNHGMSRTVPTVTDKYVVAIDPKCNVVCLDAAGGELMWGINLVSAFGATIPAWYTGQCPLVDGDRVILAPGGNDSLVVAVELATGKPVWKTPNPRGWKMTHASLMPMEWAGRRMYVYCGSGGVAGVSATDGSLLWDTTDWRISIATVPSPVPMTEGRIFLSGGYNAGSALLQLEEKDGQIVPRAKYRLPPEVFGATQHSPVLLDGRICGIRANGHFVSLDPATGKVAWSSGSAGNFGLGPFLAVPGMVFALNDGGVMSLFEASPDRFNLLSRAQVLKGRESWGPMAIAGSRLIVRDLTRMICLEVGK